jgi:hypothetical protein
MPYQTDIITTIHTDIMSAWAAAQEQQNDDTTATQGQRNDNARAAQQQHIQQHYSSKINYHTADKPLQKTYFEYSRHHLVEPGFTCHRRNTLFYDLSL